MCGKSNWSAINGRNFTFYFAHLHRSQRTPEICTKTGIVDHLVHLINSDKRQQFDGFWLWSQAYFAISKPQQHLSRNQGRSTTVSVRHTKCREDNSNTSSLLCNTILSSPKKGSKALHSCIKPEWEAEICIVHTFCSCLENFAQFTSDY